MFIRSLMLVLLLSSFAFAQETAPLERPPGKVECLEEALKTCTYSIQNSNAQAMIRKINLALFSGVSLISSEEGHLEEVSPKKISFWHRDEKLRKNIIDLIPYLDRYDEFVASALVEVSVEIYSSTQSGLRSFEGAIQSINMGNSFGKTKEMTPVENSETVKLSFNMGSVALSGVLNASRTSGDIEQVAKITQIVPNQEALNFKQTKPVYIKVTDVTTKDDKTGVEVSGQISISQDSENLPLVLVKNFNLSYGVQTGPQDVSTVKLDTGSVFLTEGVSSVLVSVGTFTAVQKKTNSFLGLKRTDDSTQAQLLVILRARPISYDDFVKENQKLASTDTQSPHFKPEDIAKMPVGDNKSFLKALNTLEPLSELTPSGDPILGFRLSKDAATQNILKQQVRVRVKGGGIDQQGVRTVEQLMQSLFRIKPLTKRSLRDPEVVLEVTLEDARNKREVEDAKWVYQKRTIKLLYNPQTNDFLRAN